MSKEDQTWEHAAIDAEARSKRRWPIVCCPECGRPSDFATIGVPMSDNQKIIAGLFEERELLRAALQEISEGKGRFSNDPFKHACNTIDDMKQIAKDALAASQPRSTTENMGE